METMNRQRDTDIIPFSILFLFFFQLIADFVEAIYAFGLLGTSIPPEIVSVLFLFAPALLLFWRQEMGRRPFLAFAFLLLLSRLVEVMLATRGRMLVSGAGVAAGLLWLPALLWRQSRQSDTSAPARLGLGLLGGALLSALFRVLGSGTDISTVGAYQLIGWLLAGVTAVFLLRQPSLDLNSQDGSIALGRLTLLTLGLISALVLLYFVFNSPNVIARWTGFSYPAIVAVMMLALAGFAWFAAGGHPWLREIPTGLLGAGNILFVLALVGAILPYQVRFPADAGGYPLYDTAVSGMGTVFLILMLLLHPVIYLDFALFVRQITAGRPSLRALAGAFTLASLFLLILIFGHVFTTVYDYIPVVGPFFRDKFWLVHLVAGLGLALPILMIRRQSLAWPAGKWFIGVWLVCVMIMGGVFIVAARPEAAESKTAVRVLTYNIQQGYDENGLKNFDGQLALIRDVDADIIGLQESDTNRIAGGNADVVRTLAEALDMHSYYGPRSVPGTFGIALLSKYPIQNPRTFYMFSEREQTATIEAQITVGPATYNVYVTHLGNGGPIVQQEAIMQVVRAQENVILMGDFNFRPDTDQYELTTAVLDDAWLRRWPAGVDDKGLDPADRIDHIFVSADIQVMDVRYIVSDASDHPAETAVLTLSE